MKNKILVLLSALVLASSNAFSTIIIDVTDNGGFAEFTFSGSDSVSASGHINNGFWLNDLFEANAFTGNPNYLGSHTISSGAAQLVVNGSGFNISDVWVNGTNYDWELGFRSHSNPFDVFVGDTIALTGSLLTDLNFSWFNVGSYSFSSVGPYQASEATLTNGIRFNVGSTSIPEPSALLIIALGLLGFRYLRK